MVVIRGVTGGTKVPGARSTRGASGGFRVGGGTDDARETNASTGVSAATAIGLLQVQELARLTEGEKPADPGLAEAVEAIALRARLELARRGIDR